MSATRTHAPRPVRPPNEISRQGGLMTVREAAHLLQLSECSVYQLAGLGQLPSVKIGKARRFLLEDVQNFITSNRQQAV